MELLKKTKNMDVLFEKFQKSSIGNFLIEKVFFRKKNFYSLVKFLVTIILSQIAGFYIMII